MRRVMRMDLVVLLTVLLLSGCGSTAPTATPTPTVTPTASMATPSTTPAPSINPSASPADPFLGALIVTVSDRLRVRSLPEVSDASVKYEPLLPIGTELRVIGGPVGASGYVWYEVRPVGVSLIDNGLSVIVDHGWVAMADHDGQPWLALVDQPVAGLEVAASAVSRTPADQADSRTVSNGVSAFGIDLYRAMLANSALSLRHKNIVFSPTSIALALGMARAGAHGETGSQIDGVLHADGVEQLEAGLNALDQALSSRDGAYVDDEQKAHTLALRIANASFAQRGWSIEPSYLDAIASAFGAGLNLVDYTTNPEAARSAINAWVAQKTANRIPELLQPPNVSALTRLYLVNAVYLKANWVVEFRKDQTASRPFSRPDGSSVRVPTMRLAGGQEVPYLRGRGWQATELRYRGRGQTTPLAMTLIMPDDLASFEGAMTPQWLTALASDLTAERTRISESVTHRNDGSDTMDCGTYPYSLDLFMPRFKLGTRAELGPTLSALGMPLAFDQSRADFTGIHAPEGDGDSIYIANIIHQANIDVDELGTEAAAATAIGMDTGGCTGPSPAKDVTFRLDHPFLFVLRDVDTGAILFLGRVVDPSVVG